MAGLDDTLNALMTIDGAQAVALVDYESGMLLGEAGSGMDMEVAAAGNTEVIRAKKKTAASLNLNDTIEDILISLGKAYHILRPVSRKKGLFLYLVLDRNKSNLALARRKVQDVEAELAL
jgi:predicted regulator of Ras-like GTPase activity (Roadblock/LC7/MglB family)